MVETSKIQLTGQLRRDLLVWNFSMDGCYYVRTCYMCVVRVLFPNNNSGVDGN